MEACVPEALLIVTAISSLLDSPPSNESVLLRHVHFRESLNLLLLVQTYPTHIRSACSIRVTNITGKFLTSRWRAAQPFRCLRRPHVNPEEEVLEVEVEADSIEVVQQIYQVSLASEGKTDLAVEVETGPEVEEDVVEEAIGIELQAIPRHPQ